MKLDDLTRYGIPPSLIENWRERQGERLLPLQSSALRAGLLSDRRGRLITGPTSAGKSFCGELALAQALIARRKGALVVPLKSIAEEKFATLEPVYRKLNLRTIIATADHPENDSLLSAGKFDIAICVYEKFNRLLLANIDSLATLDLLVIDELQLVTDPQRGAALESLLLKLQAYRSAAGAKNSPRLIGLAATSVHDRELAEWLSLSLTCETTRPRDLRLGVAFDGEYIYRAFNSGLVDREPYHLGGAEDADSERSLTDRLLAVLRRSPGQKLVFLSSRAKAREAAFKLAAQATWPRAENAIKALSGEEPSSLTRALAQTLTRGVAFHSSDLTAAERGAVENGYRSGEIQVIFSTTTLALGVNLPADTVFIEPFKYQSGPINGACGAPGKTGAYGLLPLTQTEFAGIAGRAGRYFSAAESQSQVSTKAPIARAALLAETEFERDILWETYIEVSETSGNQETESFGAVSEESWSVLALQLIVSGLAGSEAELQAHCSRSLGWRRSPEDSELALGKALERLCVSKLIERDSDSPGNSGNSSRLCASAVGRAGALAGLSVSGIEHFCELLEKSCLEKSYLEKSYPVTEREWLAAALSAPDLDNTIGSRLPRASAPQSSPAWDFLDPDESERLISFATPARFGPGRSSSARALGRRIIALQILEFWRRGDSARAIETGAGLSVATVIELAGAANWLLSALLEIHSALSETTDINSRLRELRDSLRVGLPTTARFMNEETRQLFNRGELMALVELNCYSPEEILALPERTIIEALSAHSLGGNKTTKEKLVALTARHRHRPVSESIQTDTKKKEKQMSHLSLSHTPAAPIIPLTNSFRAKAPSGAARSSAPGLIPCRIEISGQSEGERYLVKVDNQAAPLTGKSFKYLVKLAAARLVTPDGWIYKDDIEQGFNQARYLYRMRRELEAALPGYHWPVYENNRLGYYRLRLDPGAIEIDIAGIARSEDYEVSALAESLRDRRQSA